MGRLINGPNGPFIGKAGSFIGYVVNGVGYIKGNYKPRTKEPTEKEALNRQKFAEAQHFLRPLGACVKAGCIGYNQRFQGFAAAKSYLMKNALKVIDGAIIIDPSLVKISYGNLPLPKSIECTFHEPQTFHFTWDPSGSGEYDQVMVVVYDVKRKREYGYVYGSYRKTGEQLVKVENPEGQTLHAYIAFISADRSRQSDSVYLGKFEF